MRFGLPTIFSKLGLTAAVSATAVLTGCATTSTISPQYIPPSQYESYDCSQLQSELSRVESYVEDAQNEQSTFSTSGMGVGLGVGRGGIYPSISFGVGKSTDNEARDNKLARLYGEHDAIIQAGRLKSCNFVQGVKIYGE